MKRKVLTTLLTVMTAGLMMMRGAWVYAQPAEPDLKTNVPFKFMVGDTTLPAGEYTIKRIDDNEPNVLEVESANDRVNVAFISESAQADHTPANSGLVFHKFGNKYFLSQIWVAGEKTGDQLTPSRSERKLEEMGAKMEQRSVECHQAHRHMKKKMG